MIPLPTGVRVFLATGHTDMRRGMNSLALLIQQILERDPHCGDLYVFRGKNGKLIKILWHDGIGMSLYAKRLERGHSFGPRVSAIRSRSRRDSSVISLKESIGGIPCTAIGPRWRAECGALTHKG